MPSFSSASTVLGQRTSRLFPPQLPVLLVSALGAAVLQQFNLITWQRALRFLWLVLCWVTNWNQHGDGSKEQESAAGPWRWRGAGRDAPGFALEQPSSSAELLVACRALCSGRRGEAVTVGSFTCA